MTDSQKLCRDLLFLVIIGQLVACSNTPTKPVEKPINITYKQPHWIENPELENHLTVVGSAMPQNMGGLEGQRRAALLRARAELAKNVRVFVSKSLSIEKQNAQANAKVNQRIKTRAVELQQLTTAQIKAEWTNPQNNELFIWYVIAVK